MPLARPGSMNSAAAGISCCYDICAMPDKDAAHCYPAITPTDN